MQTRLNCVKMSLGVEMVNRSQNYQNGESLLDKMIFVMMINNKYDKSILKHARIVIDNEERGS